MVGYLQGLLGEGRPVLRDVSFYDHGLSSLQLVELVRFLSAELRRELSPALAWEYPSVVELVGHLCGEGDESHIDRNTSSEARGEDIAIIGMSCRFPGAPDLESFWQLCWDGIDAIKEVPLERWDAAALYDPDSAVAGKACSRWGGFLENIDCFDAAFFGITPREAVHMDPRQRLALETSWEALEDAGLPPSELAGRRVGVFIATLSDDYGRLVFADPQNIDAYSGTGTAHSVVANRLSYFYDFHGPSVVVDTACSGSLVALHLACQSLRSNESDVALVGGVNVILTPDSTLFFSRVGALSRVGRCKTFDRSADGFVRSEGIGMIVLKRYADAVDSGDLVYAVVRGSAMNQDGHTNGIMAPSGRAQQAVLRQACRNAGVSPGLVQYVEAHGTGTPLGDPIEAEALDAVLREGRPARLGCLIGSVKTNIGHTESAAGMAGVIKVAMALSRGALPGSIHFNEANPLIPFDRMPFKVASRSGGWPDPSRRLYAGVSGFGFGGTNAHVVLGASPPRERDAGPVSSGAVPLLLSARSPAALRSLAHRYAALLRENPEGLHGIARAAGQRRDRLRFRLALVVRSPARAAEDLEAAANGGSSPRLVTGMAPAKASKTAFVFSGQGSHWPGMGLDLLTFPAFSRTFERCDALTRLRAGFSLCDEIARPESDSRLDRSDIGQLAIFTVQAALHDLLRSFGVAADMVVGQSLGEVAAAYASGSLSLEDAWNVAWHRGRLMREVQGKGRTALVGLPASEVEAYLVPWGMEVSVAGASSPRSTVISGGSDAIREIIAQLENRQVFARMLAGIDVAFHSSHMDPLLASLAAALKDVAPSRATLPFYSTVDASFKNGRRLGADYWVRNLREPFQLATAIRDLLAEDVSHFIELSPHPLLGRSILESAGEKADHTCVFATLRRSVDAQAAIADVCARLFVQGHGPDWSGGHRATMVKLPHYPWQRERYWIEARRQNPPPKDGGRHPFLGSHVRLAASPQTHVWETDLASGSPRFLGDHRVFGRVVFPAAAYVEIGLEAAESLGIAESLALFQIQFESPLVIPDDGDVRVQIVAAARAGEGGTCEIYALAPNPGEGSFARHARMQFRSATDFGTDWMDIDILRSRCMEAVSMDAHLAAMAERGLDYGPLFQVLQEIQVGEGEAVARLRPAEPLRNGAGRYRIHPVYLDAALQLTGVVVSGIGAASYLPAGIERLEWHSDRNEPAWVHASIRGVPVSGAEVTADLELLTETGEVIARASGLTLRSVEASSRRSNQDNVSDWTYGLSWERLQGPAPFAGQTVAPGTWVLIGSGELAEVISSRLSHAGGRVVRVSYGGRFEVLANGTGLIVRPNSRDDLRRVLEAARGAAGSDGIGALWLDALDSDDGVDLLASATALTERLLAVVQGLTADDLPPRLWIVSRGAQPVAGVSVPRSSLAQSAVWGLGRMAQHEEHVGLRGALIDLDPRSHDLHLDAELILAEVLCTSPEDQVAFRNGERYALRLRHAPAVSREVVLDPGAAYLVTGGLGALGLEAARWYCSRGARRIVLMGRHMPPDRAEWERLPPDHPLRPATELFQSVEAQGCQVECIVVDVADRSTLRAALEARGREHAPPIRGVLHAAGEVRDARICNAGPEDVARIFAGKVGGALNLVEVLVDTPLDFMLLYSSLASVMPATGQGVYAAANAVLDSLSHHLRAAGLPCTSVDWGPWRSGMMLRAGSEAFHASRGVYAMDPHSCTRMLDEVIAGDRAQWVVVSADWNRVHESRAYVPQMIRELGSVAADEVDGPGSPVKLRHRLVQGTRQEGEALLNALVRSMVSKVFRMADEHLDGEHALTSLGLDSMMATELKNRLEAACGIAVSAVDLLRGLSIREIVDRSIVQLLHTASDSEAILQEVDPDVLAQALEKIEAMSEAEILAELEEAGCR